MEPHGHSLAWLLVAKIVCCGALVLSVAGLITLAGIASWFLEGGFVWLAVAVLAIAAIYLWRQRTRIRETHAGKGSDGGAKHRSSQQSCPEGCVRLKPE